MDSLMNELGAGMQKVDLEAYIKDHEKGLKHLDKIRELVKKVKVGTVEEYQKAMDLKSFISSLFCYAFNNNKDYETVGKIESILGNKIYKFAAGHRRIKDKTVRAVAKYVITCWTRYYSGENEEKILKVLLENNLLFRSNEDYCVVGLHYAVGDNTFTIARDGGEYRNYIKSCAIQAFYVKSRWERIIKRINPAIPDLPGYYDKVAVGDGKYRARVYLSDDEKGIICSEFVN